MHFIERMLFYVSSHQEKVKIYLVGDHSDRCGISARANHALLFSALTQAGHMAHTVADFPHSTATSKKCYFTKCKYMYWNKGISVYICYSLWMDRENGEAGRILNNKKLIMFI